jgi:hypothetical protein
MDRTNVRTTSRAADAEAVPNVEALEPVGTSN